MSPKTVSDQVHLVQLQKYFIDQCVDEFREIRADDIDAVSRRCVVKCSRGPQNADKVYAVITLFEVS